MISMKRALSLALAAALLALVPVTTAGAATTIRVSDVNRYAGAVAIAAQEFDTNAAEMGIQWPPTIRHLVIASGEDRAAADPLSAAGLCGIYNAPLLLVSSTRVDPYVKQTIAELCGDATGQVTLHVVGGKTSVPDAIVNQIVTAAGGTAELKVDRIASAGNRYDLSAAIARRVKAVAWPATDVPVVLIANGADSTKFFDALALSPIAAAQHYPILLVSKDNVPDATLAALDDISTPGVVKIIVGGGPNTVGGIVYNFFTTATPTERWYGATRYETAISIADHAVGKGWLARTTAGAAAKLPDALTGGAMLGLNNGPLVLTTSTLPLNSSTASWLTAHKAEISTFYVYGGIYSVTPETLLAIDDKLN